MEPLPRPHTARHLRRSLALPNRDAFDALWREAFAEFGQAAPRVVAALIATAAASAERSSGPEVEVVWTGPTLATEALYRTEQRLLAFIRQARTSILVVAYVAYKAEAVREALADAVARGVRVRLVVESAREDGGAVSFDPRRALGGLDDPRFECFAWPRDQRDSTEPGEVGALHAKCVAVDDEALFVSSANMTESALARNLELGLVVRGGYAARHVREHVERLTAAGVLVRRPCAEVRPGVPTLARDSFEAISRAPEPGKPSRAFRSRPTRGLRRARRRRGRHTPRT